VTLGKRSTAGDTLQEELKAEMSEYRYGNKRRQVEAIDGLEFVQAR
jgi:hypothetical protein